MLGMDARTGKRIEGDAHLVQSIADVLTTPIGSRVMRRDYGSLLLDLIDQPFTPLLKLRLFAAVAVALSRWEPRIRVRKIAVEQGDQPGAFVIGLEADRTDQAIAGELARLIIPLRLGANASAAAFA